MGRSDVVANDTIEALCAEAAPYKAVASEAGWLYLINDTNDFLRLFFGLDAWSQADGLRAVEVIRNRVKALKELGVSYCKLVIPEKPVVYPEYLPSKMLSLARAPIRPAQILAAGAPEHVHYLAAYFASVKGLGQLYFRGDSHTNWFGGWLLYRMVVHQLRAAGLALAGNVFDISALRSRMAAYSGDLVQHLSPAASADLRSRLGHTMPRDGLEYSNLLDLEETQRQARRVETPEDYVNWYDSRETFIFERADGLGPRVIFFRDSTFDRGVMELLAEHCARSVFIWHLGQVDGDAIDRERPDFVVQSMAERFVTRYPTFPPLFRAGAHYAANIAPLCT